MCTQAPAQSLRQDRNVQARISSVVEMIIGHSISPSQPMTEAGLDSLGAIELGRSLEQAFGVELPATLAFDYPTVEALAHYISLLHDNHPAAGQPSSFSSDHISTQFAKSDQKILLS